MDSWVWTVMIPVVSIAAFWGYMVVLSLSRSRVRELEIRERIAMIEKGLVPAPEADPRGFDRAMSRYDRRPSAAGHRHRRAGVTLIGVGLAVMVLITFAGELPRQGLGIGGMFVMLGLAFVVNSLLEQAQDPADGSHAKHGESRAGASGDPAAPDSSHLS